MIRGKVRWGVLSTANIGRAAVNPAIQASHNSDLRAVASRDSATAAAFAKDHGIPTSYGSYEALLDDPDIDAIYIPLPNSLHREWTVRAAQAGKHVLCEKPLALDVGECREMVDVAREAGVHLMEAFMYRFHPRTVRVLDLVRAGHIGQLGTVRSAFTFRLTSAGNIRLDPDLGGGSLMDVGCYCVNVTRTLAGAEPVEVQAAAQWASTGVDDHMAGVLRFPGGVLGHFDCSLKMERREFYEAAGEDGTLVVDNAFLPGNGPVSIDERRGRLEDVRHEVDGADEYGLMVDHFSECVLGNAVPRYPAEEAAGNMATIVALLRSARNGGRTVEV